MLEVELDIFSRHAESRMVKKIIRGDRMVLMGGELDFDLRTAYFHHTS
jgi:hypothetical protein